MSEMTDTHLLYSLCIPSMFYLTYQCDYYYYYYYIFFNLWSVSFYTLTAVYH